MKIKYAEIIERIFCAFINRFMRNYLLQKESMELMMLVVMIIVAVVLVVSAILVQSWLSPEAMDGLPGTLGWPVVGESFSFISEFSSPAGVYSFIKRRQKL